jgi:RNA polymerase sigma-70 factor (ECF subfamily)
METRYSLLARAQGGDQGAWNRFTDLYRPLIVGWLRRQGLEHHDAEDLAQDVLVAVIRHLADFNPSGQRGAFRRWLRTIAVNRTRDFWKARNVRPAAPGGSALLEMADRLEDPDSDLARQWDEEHDRYVLRCLLDLVGLEFEPATVQAFRRLALEGAPATDVAGELGLSVGAVYVAKSRVLKRIREEAEGLIDEPQ